MDVGKLISRVLIAKNPYSKEVLDAIQLTKYVSWRKHLQKATQIKLPMFLSIVNKIDKTVHLPIFGVMERLFLDFSMEDVLREEVRFTSCFRGSPLPPLGLLVLSLYTMTMNSNKTIPQAIHRLGYAAELLQIAFEVHKCVVDHQYQGHLQHHPDKIHTNNKYAILLGDYIFAQCTEVLASLKAPRVVELMSQAIISTSHSLVEQKQYVSTFVTFSDWKKLVGRHVFPLSFESVSHLIKDGEATPDTDRRSRLFLAIGRHLNYLTEINRILSLLKSHILSLESKIRSDKRFEQAYDMQNKTCPHKLENNFTTYRGLENITCIKVESLSSLELVEKLNTLYRLEENFLQKRSDLSVAVKNLLHELNPHKNPIQSLFHSIIDC